MRYCTECGSKAIVGQFIDGEKDEDKPFGIYCAECGFNASVIPNVGLYGEKRKKVVIQFDEE